MLAPPGETRGQNNAAPEKVIWLDQALCPVVPSGLHGREGLTRAWRSLNPNVAGSILAIRYLLAHCGVEQMLTGGIN
jgi:hypothetical protein